MRHCGDAVHLRQAHVFLSSLPTIHICAGSYIWHSALDVCIAFLLVSYMPGDKNGAIFAYVWFMVRNELMKTLEIDTFFCRVTC